MTLPGFIECDRCKGTGELDAVAALMDTIMKDSPQRVICPAGCVAGLQPDPAVLEACTEPFSPPVKEILLSHWRDYAVSRVERQMAQAVLLAYAREVQT